MTRLFDEEGKVIPVTLVEAGPCVVVQVKTFSQEGYEALQLGFQEKEKRVNKPLDGHFKKVDLKPLAHLKEFRPREGSGSYKVGDKVSVEIFSPGDKVDVTGISKGKGFQGVMKRHGFAGGPASHGSTSFRRVGSVGASSWPSRVFKGKKMPGHMGAERKTMQNLQVIQVDAERNLLFIKGCVPGAKGGLLEIRKTSKGVKS